MRCFSVRGEPATLTSPSAIGSRGLSPTESESICDAEASCLPKQLAVSGWIMAVRHSDYGLT